MVAGSDRVVTVAAVQDGERGDLHGSDNVLDRAGLFAPPSPVLDADHMVQKLGDRQEISPVETRIPPSCRIDLYLRGAALLASDDKEFLDAEHSVTWGDVMKKAAVAVCGAAVALVMTMASSASASEYYVNKRSQFIASLPAADAYTCQQQHIHIVGGGYDWAISGLEVGSSHRYMNLADGWYKWTDCLRYDHPGDYYQYSELDPDDPAYATADLGNWDYSVGTTYYWGSNLTSV